MDASEIKPGIKVTKGWHDYTVVSTPVNDVFKAKDSKGEIVVLYVAEVMRCTTGEDS